MATIYGTFTYFKGVFDAYYHDTLVGTRQNDTIYGLGGDDEIWGSAGNDVMYGGSGDDIIRPGTPQYDDTTPDWGIDEVYGGIGDDQIFGGSNNDIFDGGPGLDGLYGGGGDDEIAGGADTDWILGEDGNDDLFGGDGSDELHGGPGFDELFGGEGSDLLNGGAHGDILWGGAGGDALTGGSSYDTFKYIFPVSESSVDNPDQIMDFSATEGDLIDLSETMGPTAFNYAEDTISGSGCNDAKLYAASLLDGSNMYAFVTDQVDGYLFADFNEDGTIDTGIILVGLTKVSDFDYYNML
jgi:Ca2+-binding RTX toxin-like protein